MGASSATALATIQQAVKHSFRLSGEDVLVLKYLDDEGDLCTLADGSLEDLAAIAKGRSWRLQASLGARPVAAVAVPVPANAPGQAGEEADACPASAPVE